MSMPLRKPVQEGEISLHFPEGGRTAWLVVFGSWCAMLQIFGLINASGVLETYFKDHLLQHHSHTEIGWIFSLYLFFVFFVGVLVGPLFDRLGPRIFISTGSLMIVSSLMILSIARSYYEIMLCYSVAGGIGGALLYAPATGAIAHYFDEKRGLATGLAFTAGGFGGVLLPPLMHHLLSLEGVGFPWTCRILAFIMLAAAVPANIFIKARLTSERISADQPASATNLLDPRILVQRRFALASVGYLFMEWGLFVPLAYITSYGGFYEMPATDSALMLSIINAASVFGRFIPGFLSDKLGRFNVIIMTIALCAISVLTIWLPCQGRVPELTTFSILFGAASGSNLSLIPVCLGQFCEAQHYGRYITTATMLASFGSLTSVPIAGALLAIEDGETGWRCLILFCGSAYLLALMCYGAARVITVGWKLQAKF
ncbi:major facilitator superfamily domain-containing protein [Stachybotrys elegans]|uniref:Major facilitator superfamily domain-containing protein n=1 Tax=Stachybotrys elegans TaxID=80388 RepID=A0A8K0WP02_9HYPO|nr:major facilitator superfamily domain-containing protein [Stachybotrys elegans]